MERQSFMDRCRNSRVFRAFCAIALAIGLTPVQYFALGIVSSQVPAYATSATQQIRPDDREYAQEKADGSKVGQDAQMRVTDKFIGLKNLFVDKDKVDGKDSIIDAWKKGDDAILFQNETSAQLYDPGDQSAFYVANVSSAEANGTGDISDITLIQGTNGSSSDKIDGAYIDQDKKLIYIPKKYYDDENARIPQAQTMVRTKLDQGKTKVDVSVYNESKQATAVAKSFVVSSDTYDVSMDVPVTTPETAANITAKDLSVTINGNESFPVPVDGENAAWNPKTGELALMAQPAQVSCIDVTIHDNGGNAVQKAYADDKTDSTAKNLGYLKDVWGNKVNFDKLAASDVKQGDFDTFYTAQEYRASGSFQISDSGALASAAGHAKNYLYRTKGDSDVDSQSDWTLFRNGGTDGDIWSRVKKRGFTSSYYLANFAMAWPGKSTRGANKDYSLETGDKKGWLTKKTKNKNGSDAPKSSRCAIALQCAELDLSSKYTHKKGEDKSYAGMRFVYVDPDGDFAILAFISSQFTTQAGSGMYKVGLKNGEYLAITKQTTEKGVELWQKDKMYRTMTGQNGFKGAEFKVYTDKACTKRAEDLKGKKILLNSEHASSYKKGDDPVDAEAMFWWPNPVKPGTYYVKETKVPEFYKKPEKQYQKIEVKTQKTLAEAKKKASTYKVVNAPVYIHIPCKIIKHDDKGTPLKGAEFKLTQYANLDGTTKGGKVKNDTIKNPYVSDASGNVDLSSVEFWPGTYILQESKAPDPVENGLDKSVQFTGSVRKVIVVAWDYDDNNLKVTVDGKVYLSGDLRILRDSNYTLMSLENSTSTTKEHHGGEPGDGGLKIVKHDTERSGAGADENDDQVPQGDTAENGTFEGTGKFEVKNVDEIGYWTYSTRHESVPHIINHTDGTSSTWYEDKYYHTWHWNAQAEPGGHVEQATVGQTLDGLPVTQDKGMFSNDEEIYDGGSVFSYDTDTIPFQPTPYTVEEKEAPNGYKLPDGENPVTVNIEKNGTSIVYGEATFREAPWRTKIKISKNDSKLVTVDGNQEKPQGTASLAGARFAVYLIDTGSTKSVVTDDGQTVQPTTQEAALANGAAEGGEGCVGVIETGEDGFGTSDFTVPNGTYFLVETQAPDGYVYDDEHPATIGPFKVDLNEDEHPEIIEKTYKLGSGATNEVERGGFEIYKIDADDWSSEDESQDNVNTPQGDASLEGAVFTVTNTSPNPAWYEDGGKLLAAGTGTFTISATWDASAHDGRGAYVAKTGEKALPVGTYHVVETTAPKGYELGDPVFDTTVTIESDGDYKQLDFENDGAGARDKVIRGGFEFQKTDSKNGTTPQGDASLGVTQLKIVNKSKNRVTVDGGTVMPGDAWYVSTDENGYFKSSDNYMPVGTYEVYETGAQADDFEDGAPDGYLVNDKWVGKVRIGSKGQMVSLTGDKGMPEEVQRGNLIIGKGDTKKYSEGDTKADKNYAADGEGHEGDGQQANYWNYAEGDATLAGAEFTIYNESANPVWFDGKNHANGDPVMTIETKYDKELHAWVAKTPKVSGSGPAKGRQESLDSYGALPMGRYKVVETKAPKGYLRNGSIADGTLEKGMLAKEFSISSEGETVSLVYENGALNDVVHGGVTVGKADSELVQFKNADGTYRWNCPQGDASLEKAKFEVVNDSAHGVEVDGKWYSKGEVVKTIETAWDEAEQAWVAKTGDHDLPYGTYKVREAKSGDNAYDKSGAPEGYLYNDEPIEKLEIRADGQVIVKKYEDGITNDVQRGTIMVGKGDTGLYDANLTNGSLNSEESKDGIQGKGEKANYWNYAQGDASLDGAEFTLYNRSANPVWYDKDTDGKATEDEIFEPNAAMDTLTVHYDKAYDAYVASTPTYGGDQGDGKTAGTVPYGTYELVETKTPQGYLPTGTVADGKLDNGKLSITVQVRSEKEVKRLYFDKGFENDVMRGGAIVGKADSGLWDVNGTIDHAQGDATLEGAVLEVVNKSAHAVLVGGKWYKQDEVVETITTKWDDGLGAAVARTGDHDLPYGTYEVREAAIGNNNHDQSGAPIGYLHDGTLTQTFEVRADGEVHVLDNNKTADQTEKDGETGEAKGIRNHVQRGKIVIGKGDNAAYDAEKTDGDKSQQGNDANYWRYAQGDASFAGAEYSIYNRSAHEIWFDGKGGKEVDGKWTADEIVPTGSADTDDNLVGTFKTEYNEKLDAWTIDTGDRLPYGTYDVVETKSPKGYLQTGSIAGGGTVEIDGRTCLAKTVQIRDQGEEHDLYYQDGFLNDVVRGGVKVGKADKTLWDANGTIDHAQGDATLEGAVLEVVNDSDHSVLVGGTWYHKGQVVETITTKWDEGLGAAIAATGERDLPYGSYIVREAKNGNNNYDQSGAPTGYLHKGDLEQRFQVREDGKTYILDNNTKNENAVKDGDGIVEGIRNEVQRGQIVIGKGDSAKYDEGVTQPDASDKDAGANYWNYAEGDASFAGAEYTIYNRSEHEIWYDKNGDGKWSKDEIVPTGTDDADANKVGTFKTEYNEKLDAWTVSTGMTLPYGTYDVVETKAPTGYLKSGTVANGGDDGKDDLSVMVQIRNQDETHDLYWKDGFLNDVVRGGVAVGKADKTLWDANGTIDHAQGDATLEGAVLEIVNKSHHSVLVGGTWYHHGDVVETITTQWDESLGTAIARSGERDLPYGTYEVREAENGDNNHVRADGTRSGAPVGYRHMGDLKQEFQVREDGTVYVLDNNKANDSAVKDPETGIVEGIRNEVQRGSIVIGKGDNGKYDEAKTAGDVSRGGAGAKWHNYAQGDASFAGAEYTVYNRSAHEIWFDRDGNDSWLDSDGKVQKDEIIAAGTEDTDANKVGTFKTEYNEKLDAWTVDTGNRLPYGTYDVVETKAPEGYLQTGSIAGGGTVDIDGRTCLDKIVQIRDEGDVAQVYKEYGFANDVVRGGAKVGKADSVLVKYTKTDEDGSGKETTVQKWNCPQGDADLSNALFEVVNSSDHSVLVGDTWVKSGEVCEYITTQWDDAEQAWVASTGERDLPYGTYTVREAKSGDNAHDKSGAPEGYLWSDMQVTFQVRHDGEVKVLKQDKGIANDVQRGSILIGKGDKERYGAGTTGDDKSDGGNVANYWNYAEGDASFEGAEFTVYNRSKNPVWFDANGDGKATDGEIVEVGGKVGTFGTKYDKELDAYTVSTGKRLPYGTYEVVETKAPAGYTADGTVSGGGKDADNRLSKTVEVRDEGQTVQLVAGDGMLNEVVKGDVQVTKSDYDLSQQKANGEEPVQTGYLGMSLHGIDFKVVNDSAHSVLVDGKWCHKGDVVATITSHWNAKTSSFTAETTGKALPYGTYKVVEVAKSNRHGVGMANDAYMVNDTVLTFEVREDGSVVKTGTDGADLDMKDKVIRNDMHLEKKTDEQSGAKLLPHVPFLITNTATGESHVAVTDSNGYLDTCNDWNEHTYKTNENDRLKTYTTIKSSDVDEDAGIWFGTNEAGGTAPAIDDRGALPYGTYTIQEMRCESNEGYALWNDTFTVSRDLSMTDGKRDVNLGTVYDRLLPVIATKATDTADGDKYVDLGRKGASVTDTVSYSHLTVGKWYAFTARLADANGTTLKNADGTDIVGKTRIKADKTDGEVTVKLPVANEELAKIGKATVFERLYELNDSDGTFPDIPVATHEVPNDEDQTVHLVKIGTTATDASDGDKWVDDSGRIHIDDAIAYEGLETDVEHVAQGTLYDRATGKPATDDNGDEITATAKFTPKAPTGTVTVNFEFDGTKLAGHDLVAFEKVWRSDVTGGFKPGEKPGDNPVATHEDIDDGGQTVTVVEIRTTATDKGDGDHYVSPTTGTKAHVVDAVKYKGLDIGSTYLVSGVLHVKNDDGTDAGPLLDADGNEVKASKTFTAEHTHGTVELEFEFDASLIADRTFVAFETLSTHGRQVAVHADIADGDQTVRGKSIGTTATDKADGDKSIGASETSTIDDQVTYRGLTPGKGYTLVGIVYDRTTGLPLVFGDGTDKLQSDALALDKAVKRITHPDNGLVPTDALASLESAIAGYPDLSGHIAYAKKNFRPVRSDDAETLDIALDSSALKNNRKLVVFEYLFAASDVEGAGKGNLVTTHEDIDDEGQTVTVKVPRIRTTLVDSTDGDHTILPSGKAKVVDTVRYWNCEPGKTYTIVGRLVHQSSGKQVYAADEPVTASATFTAEKSDGSAKVTFPFDATKLGGKKLVAFERLYRGSDEGTTPGSGGYIAKHEDKGDHAQTVTVEKAPKQTPGTPTKTGAPGGNGHWVPSGTPDEGNGGGTYDKTGETVLPWLVGAAVLCAAAAFALAWGIRRRRREALAHDDVMETLKGDGGDGK